MYVWRDLDERLTVRAYNCLTNQGFNTDLEVKRWVYRGGTTSDLHNWYQCGKKTAALIASIYNVPDRIEGE